jgi:hypothetical protein
MRHAVPWRARTEASLPSNKDLNSIINLDPKPSPFFSCSRGVPWTRGASTGGRPVPQGHLAPWASRPSRSGRSRPRRALLHTSTPHVPDHAQSLARGRQHTCEGSPPLLSWRSPEALCLFPAQWAVPRSRHRERAPSPSAEKRLVHDSGSQFWITS